VRRHGDRATLPFFRSAGERQNVAHNDEEDPQERPGRTLDSTLGELDGIIENTRQRHGELGIFPSMYRSVTAEIRDAVRTGFFDDGVAMERLAVTFADRYVEAYWQWSREDACTESWRVAFEAATDGRRRMIAQHLLAGMNAHINLDLGIVAAGIAKRDPDGLYPDFLRVNQILFEKLNGLQDCLGSVSARMAWVDRLGGTLDERLMRMAIRDARNQAWVLAMDLIEHPADADAIIDTRDIETADRGESILGGTLAMRGLSRFVAASEPRDPSEILDAFMGTVLDLDAVEAAVSGEVNRGRSASGGR
jgi:hypothetical protein